MLPMIPLSNLVRLMSCSLQVKGGIKDIEKKRGRKPKEEEEDEKNEKPKDTAKEEAKDKAKAEAKVYQKEEGGQKEIGRGKIPELKRFVGQEETNPEEEEGNEAKEKGQGKGFKEEMQKGSGFRVKRAGQRGGVIKSVRLAIGI